MRLESDAAEREANLRKHGIDFADCAPLFESLLLVVEGDREDYGEIRYIGVGLLNGREVTAVWTTRGETIRMISARRAHEKERQRYREGR